MPEHPSPGLRHGWLWWCPAVGVNRNPLGMNSGCIGFELHHFLLLCTHQPTFAAWLFRWLVGGAVTGQGGGATATESALQSTCCRRKPLLTMAAPIVAGGTNRSRMPVTEPASMLSSPPLLSLSLDPPARFVSHKKPGVSSPRRLSASDGAKSKWGSTMRSTAVA